MNPSRLLLPLVIAACAAPDRAQESADAEAAILAAHAMHRRAHIEADPGLMLATFASDFVNLSRGDASPVDTSAWRARFGAYVGGSTFTAWDDAAPPVIALSDDGTMASATVVKRVHRRWREGDSLRAEGVRYAWLETWRRTPAGWRLAAIASTVREEALAPDGTREVFRVAPEGLLAEGVAYDHATGDTYVGSAYRGLVLRRNAAGMVDTVPLGELGGVLGLRVDERHRRLWVATADYPGRMGHPVSADTAAEVVIWDLEAKRVLGRHRRPRQGPADAFNDIAVDADGIGLVTGFGFGDVTELSPDGAVRTRREIEGAAPNGIALDPAGTHAWVSTGKGIVRLERASGEVVPVTAPVGVSLARIDGLYHVGGALLAVQWLAGKAGAANVVVRYPLRTPVEVGVPEVLVDDPAWLTFATTGAVIGDTLFRVIADAQFGRTDSTGALAKGARLEATRLVDVPLAVRRP